MLLVCDEYFLTENIIINFQKYNPISSFCRSNQAELLVKSYFGEIVVFIISELELIFYVIFYHFPYHLGEKFFVMLCLSLSLAGKLFDAVDKTGRDVLLSTSLMTQNVVGHRFFPCPFQCFFF
jgi:hypothetical protein